MWHESKWHFYQLIGINLQGRSIIIRGLKHHICNRFSLTSIRFVFVVKISEPRTYLFNFATQFDRTKQMGAYGVTIDI